MRFTLFILIAAFAISGCTSIGYTPAEMKPKETVYSFLDENELNKNVKIGSVTLAPEMPKYGYVVKDTLFKEALRQAFDQAGWLNETNKAKYSLNAHFIKHEVPFSVFNTKVFSVVHYDLIERRTGKKVYDQTIKMPCVIGMGEIYDGNQRLIAAHACSVRENTTHLLRDLNNNF